jgi:hypothetical protein
MSYTLTKVEELNGGVLATVINDADLLHIKQGGVDKPIAFSSFKTQIPNYGYLSGLFDNADLNPSYIWSLNHAKNTRIIRLTLYNPAGEFQSIPYIIVDANNISVNFGGPIETGDWEYILEFWTGASGGAYPDPIYALASQLPITTNPVISGSPQAGLTIVEYTLTRYGRVVSGHVVARATAINTYYNWGTIDLPPSVTRRFLGAPGIASNYETGYGKVLTTGIIQLQFGKANLDTIFDINYIF